MGTIFIKSEMTSSAKKKEIKTKEHNIALKINETRI